MPRPVLDQQKKVELSRIILAEINASSLIHEIKVVRNPLVLGQSRRALLVDYTYYEQEKKSMKFKITITIEAEEGVTADQIRDVLQDGDCGDFDKLVADDGMLKVKVKAIEEEA